MKPKLTPNDISNQEFDGAISGYSKKQVREFLDKVAQVLTDEVRANRQLRDELIKRDQTIEELQVGEAELKRAVIAAERVGNDMKKNAKREADLIVQEAKNRRLELLRDAELRLKQLRGELSRLERENQMFREQFRGMLKAYETSLDRLPSEPVAPSFTPNTTADNAANPLARPHDTLEADADADLFIEEHAES